VDVALAVQVGQALQRALQHCGCELLGQHALRGIILTLALFVPDDVRHRAW
jgi:hypothetical protein